MSDAFLEVAPLARPPRATVRVPGSKSISNRALLLAALARGESRLDGALASDDTRYMAAALTALGIELDADEAQASWRVVGCGGEWPVPRAELFTGNAGTATRFLVAALCLGDGRYTVDGNARMRERPIADLVDALDRLGARLRCPLGTGCPPVVVEGGLRGGRAEIAGDRSSQFLSAILQIAPCCPEDTTLEVRGTLIAKPYVDMTIGVMQAFGAEVERDGYARFRIAGRQTYRGRDYAIEPDASSAHYFWAAAALTGGSVRVEGLGRSSLQGDVRFADVLARMGAEVRWEPQAIEVRGTGDLKGIDVDMNEISDTAPTLAVLGAFASGPVRLSNVEHVRWQESDRLSAVATELGRLGVRVEESTDGLVVHPSPPRPGLVRTYDDHRIAMSFALAGLRVDGIRIADPECVTKTFPGYFARLKELGE